MRNGKDGALFCRALTTEGCEVITGDDSTTVTKAVPISEQSGFHHLLEEQGV